MRGSKDSLFFLCRNEHLFARARVMRTGICPGRQISTLPHYIIPRLGCKVKSFFIFLPEHLFVKFWSSKDDTRVSNFRASTSCNQLGGQAANQLQLSLSIELRELVKGAATARSTAHIGNIYSLSSCDQNLKFLKKYVIILKKTIFSPQFDSFSKFYYNYYRK